MPEIKHSNRNKAFLFNFYIGSHSLNLSSRFKFLNKARGGIPEWCTCNMKFNVRCNSFSWLTNFWSEVVLKFHFGLNIILNFFSSCLTCWNQLHAPIRTSQYFTIPVLSFAQRLVFCKTEESKILWKSPLCWVHIRWLSEFICLKLIALFKLL